LNLGTQTDSLGRYSILLPDSLVTGRSVTMMSRLIGYKTSTIEVTLLAPTITQDFTLVAHLIAWGYPVVYATSAEAFAATSKVARALGLQDLRKARHHTGVEEIRLWLWHANGSPADLYRLTNSNGTKVGDHFLWRERREMCNRSEFEQSGLCQIPGSACRKARTGAILSCLTSDAKASAWPTLWDFLEVAGLWTLPDETAFNEANDSHVNPNYLTVELWNGTDYVRRQYAERNDRDSSARATVERVRALTMRTP
jgi:hypothetical protein